MAVSARELRRRLDRSPQATSNLLSRWLEAGLADRVARGTYVLRPLGRLHTRAVSEEV